MIRRHSFADRASASASTDASTAPRSDKDQLFCSCAWSFFDLIAQQSETKQG